MLTTNNPGNLRVSSQPWKGKILPAQGAFEAFDTPLDGIRAMAKVLITYFHEGINTIDDIIAKWAPPSENDTDSYIDAVSDAVGIDSDEVMPCDAEILCKLIPAIIKRENGRQPYDDALIASAVQEALA